MESTYSEFGKSKMLLLLLFIESLERTYILCEGNLDRWKKIGQYTQRL
jgi:hypothetical protein